MIQTVLIDDEFPVLKSIEKQLNEIPGLEVIKACTRVSEALAFLQLAGKVDMIFCDIEMLEMSGLKAAPLLKKHCNRFLFLTGHKHYALDAFEARAHGYLLKPLVKSKVLAEIDQLRHDCLKFENAQLDRRFVIKDAAKKQQLVLRVGDIICVKADDHYLDIFCKGRESPILHRAKMDDMERLLTGIGGFMRIHESYIIALSAIERITEMSVVHLNNGLKAKMSRARSKGLKMYLNDQLKP